MARVYTQCVDRKDFQFTNGEWSFVWAGLLGLLTGAFVGFGVFLGGSIPVAWVLGNMVAGGTITEGAAVAAAGAFALAAIFVGALYGAVDAVCDRLLGGKLICLGGNRCAIGRIMKIESSSFLSIDNDFSVNLLLAPHADGISDAALESDGVQGFLVAPQPAISGLGFTRYPDRTPGGSEILHCEFEGSGVRDYCIAFKVGAVAIGVALAICIAFPPACIPALIIAGIIAFLAWLIALFTTHHGDPDDAAVDPESGDISAADESTGVGGDCVIITGTWVYDGGHSGWNELHPVLTLQKLPADQCPEDEDVTAFMSIHKMWCELTAQATDPLTTHEQGKRENQWIVGPHLG